MEVIKSTSQDHPAFLFATLHNGIVSGSYIIDPETANDVDVFIPECYKPAKTTLDRYHFVQYDPLEGSAEYDQAKFYDEIKELYRGDAKINLIIVNDFFWPAYCDAHRELLINKDKYTQRKDRVNLFINSKNIIHEMLGNDVRPFEE